MRQNISVSDRGDAVEAVVTGPWSHDSAVAYESGGAERLVLNYSLGFEERTLEFLRGMRIRQLIILDPRLTSIEPIYSLAPTLESLEITTNPMLHLDVSRLGSLTALGADWAQVSSTVADARQLESLFLRRFSESDLSCLTSLEKLSCLNLKDRPKLRSLSGLSELTDVRQLGVPSASELNDISDLENVPSLEKLDLEGCRKVSDIGYLARCFRLHELNLAECGELLSVEPLGGLENLHYLYLYGSTRVIDGDLLPIAGLPQLKELRMQSRRHYRPSVTEIQRLLPRQ